MVFVESPQFTREITELMGDDEYRLLQAALLANPEAGPVSKSTKGDLTRQQVRALAALMQREVGNG